MLEKLTVGGWDLSAEETRAGALKIFINDQDTDTLSVFTLQRKPLKASPQIYAGMTLGGNFDAKERPRQHANLSVPAPQVSAAELDRRRVAVGLSPLQPQTEKVAVVFALYASPSDAAADTWGRRFTYEAPKDWKLTVGDRVLCPVGDKWSNVRDKVGTVVALNATCPVDYIKQIKARA